MNKKISLKMSPCTDIVFKNSIIIFELASQHLNL